MRCLDGLGLSGRLQVGGSCTVDHMCPLRLQSGDVLSDVLWHHPALRNHKSFVSCAGRRLQHTVLIRCGEQQAVGDIVTVEAGAVDVEDGLDELRCQLSHLMDGELHQQLVGLLLPHVAHREVDEEVVVGLAPL